MCDVFAESVKKGEGEDVLAKKIEKVFLEATDNLKWLKKGDSVMLKPVMNEPQEFPATTHPLAVKTIYRILKEKGANVFVGEQSGISNTVQSKKGIIRGSTRKNFNKIHMGDKNTKLVAFEEGGWNDYFHYKNKNAKSWRNGFYITKWIKRTDHIIILPRVSTHSLFGVTLGMKSLVGTLRDDSRIEFHNNSPIGKSSNFIAKDAGLPIPKKIDGKGLERVAEISLAVKDKLRLILFVGTEAQTTFGPNKKMILFKSYVCKPREGLVFAGKDFFSSDLFALSYLKFLYQNKTPKTKKIIERIFLPFSKRYHNLEESIYQNRFIQHGKEIGLKFSGIKIHWGNVSEKLRKNLIRILK